METPSRYGKFDPCLFSAKCGGCVTGYKHVFRLRAQPAFRFFMVSAHCNELSMALTRINQFRNFESCKS